MAQWLEVSLTNCNQFDLSIDLNGMSTAILHFYIVAALEDYFAHSPIKYE